MHYGLSRQLSGQNKPIQTAILDLVERMKRLFPCRLLQTANVSDEPAWMGPAPVHHLQSAAVFPRQKEAGTYLSVTATKEKPLCRLP